MSFELTIHILVSLTSSHLPFIFSHPKKVICIVHMTSYYKLNKHTLILTTNSYKIISHCTHHHDNLTIDINSLTATIPQHSNLISLYCFEGTNFQGTPRNYDPITQMYIFCPLSKTFNVEESRPLIVPHELQQPIEVPILEFIHNTKYNHKLYNLIQNTPYEFAPGAEELKVIRALLQTKKRHSHASKIINIIQNHPRRFSPWIFPRRLR